MKLHNLFISSSQVTWSEGDTKKAERTAWIREREKWKGKLSLTVIWWLSKANYIKNSSDDVFHSSFVLLTKSINIKGKPTYMSKSEFSLHRLIGCCHVGASKPSLKSAQNSRFLRSELTNSAENEAKLLSYFRYNSTWFTDHINRLEHRKLSKLPNYVFLSFSVNNLLISFLPSRFPARLFSAKIFIARDITNFEKFNYLFLFFFFTFFFFVHVLAKFKLTCDFFYGLI